MNFQSEADKREIEDFWEMVKSSAPMYAPHHCFNCADDEFRCVDVHPFYRKDFFDHAIDFTRVAYIYECKRCKMKQVINAIFE